MIFHSVHLYTLFGNNMELLELFGITDNDLELNNKF